MRSYFQFDLSGLVGKNIESAQANFLDIYAPSCTPAMVDIDETAATNSGMNWNNQPRDIRNLAAPSVANGYSSSLCPQNTVGADATQPVIDGLNNGTHLATFLLEAGSESDQNSWKKFEPGKLDGIGPGFYAHGDQFDEIKRLMDRIRLW